LNSEISILSDMDSPNHSATVSLVAHYIIVHVATNDLLITRASLFWMR